MLDVRFKAMLDAARQFAPPPLDEMPLDAARGLYRAMCVDPQLVFDGTSRDLTVDGAAGSLGARLYVPKDAPASGPGLVYYHGGGFVIGDVDSHDGLCRRLARDSGVRLLSINYRLAPETRFPGAHEDALAAAQWAFEHAAEIGFHPARIAVGGDSAGGNLAASTAIALRDEGRYRLAFQLLLYPIVQFEGETESLRTLGEDYFLTRRGMEWFARCLFGDASRADPRANVMFTPSVADLPPALVVTAGFDPLKDEGRAYAERLAVAGVPVRHVEYGGFIHGFFNMAAVSPAVPAAFVETAGALKVALG
jgi:acetyl esterase